MTLIVDTISKTYGIQRVLNNVAFVLNAGERLGLVGPNGAGKSTLLKIITGAVEADGGSVRLAADMKLGYLPQEVAEFGGQSLDALIAEALADLRDLEAQMRALEAQMAAADADLDALMAAYGEISERFEHYGGYDIDYRVDAVLGGLGVGHIERERPFATLSGGEKARVGLALLLLEAPDVLLLDEPTNHLDYASLTWLEDTLRGYHGAALMVSHDRQFLNRTANAIVEIDEHTRAAKRYSGDYDAYLLAKTREREKWRVDYEKQQDEIRALRHDLKATARSNRNYRAPRDGNKLLTNMKIATHEQTVAKRVRSAQEKLRRIEADPIPKPPDDLHFGAEFDAEALKGRLPLYVTGLNKAFGERVILRDVAFDVSINSRIVLAGANGAGKSTLLKILAGREEADSGDIYINPAARIGYLAQEQGALDAAATLFAAYSAGLDEPEQHLKSALLQMGLFRYDDLEKRVGDLSSGQRRKLQIARLIAERANLLLLDEPTNHVSFDVLEGLEAALRQLRGPVIAATHDRRFMQQFGGQVWELRDGTLVKHLGGYAEYMAAAGGA